MTRNILRRWGILWRSRNLLDGDREFLMGEGKGPVLFETRQEARSYCEQVYGYIRGRADLRTEPHGWRMPQVVRVTVEMTYERPA